MSQQEEIEEFGNNTFDEEFYFATKISAGEFWTDQDGFDHVEE